tara:strand:+ start:805 stop:1254 length:450 start_codon:yes stop_codon:yes gene_type:complete
MPEDDARALLRDTKRVFSEMRILCNSGAPVPSQTLADWREVVKRSNQEIARLKVLNATQAERHRVEMAVFSEEMRQELVDREASAARTADRFRVLCERDSGSARTVFDRAVGSASSVEAALASLCPHAPSLNHTSKVLSERSSQRGYHV